MNLIQKLTFCSCLSVLAGCAHHPSLSTASKVDLQKFMGLWYVHGYTPILVDKEAFNAVEHYRLAENGKIQTTYQFRKGGFDGKLKTYRPVGEVYDTSTNAEWRMQFIWPFKAQYLIYYLSEDYQTTVIAHPNRKYAWIMHRQLEIDGTTYTGLVNKLVEEGFDSENILRVPHDWSNEVDRLKEYDIFQDS